MTIPVTDLFTPAAASDWLAKLLSASATVELDTTSWQSGGVALTEFQLWSQNLSEEDGIASAFCQGGFLDYAATGTVTYTASNGQTVTVPVTPEGGPGFLDALGSSLYDVDRLPAEAAEGSLAIVNVSASTYGPFAPGTYHVSNPSTNQTYHNTSTLTIAASATTNADFTADLVGAKSTAAAGAINATVTSLVGVSVSNPLAFTGEDAETNVKYADRIRLSLAALSPNGPSDAYRYAALSATQAPFNAQLSHGRVTKVAVDIDKANGVITVTVANSSGGVPGRTNLQISGATNASPIVVTVPSTTGLSVGDFVSVAGVSGNAAANGLWKIGPTLGGTTIQLYQIDGVTPSIGSGAYIAGGMLEGGDLGQIDAVIQANVVPSGDTELTQAASTLGITFAVTAYVSNSKAGVVTGDVQNGITNYLAALPIGGVFTGSTQGVPFDAVLGAIFEAAPYLQQATLTMNGGTADVSLSSTEDATATPPITVTVVLV